MMTHILLGVVVFFSSIAIDFANTRYVQAVGENRAHASARWSVLQWCSGLVGFLIAVKVTLWLLPIEIVGLYIGSWWSIRTKRENKTPP